MKRSLAKLALAGYVITYASTHALAAEPLQVVATFSILGDFAKEVGGERVEVSTLVGPNADAHVYEPRPADAIAIARADVVLTNGLGLEGFIDRLVTASGTEADIAALSDGIEAKEEPGGGHYHFVDGEAVFHAGALNAHAWQSVPNVKIYVQNTRDAFCRADVEGCESYTANADAYLAELDALDTEIRESIDALPENRRAVVVGHNAFGYFEGEYGLQFLSPQGISTESEASAADVAGLIRQMREAGTTAVFAENISDSRLVERIAAEAGTELKGILYSDALSDPNGPAPDYVSLMRHNVQTMTGALTAN
ncbi:metal ABC transporter solute-binding protein, Zn/Mn family [Aureimonas mangrovi]|uniref:metal ABC transporter solute-binding protein, Zn/Mn family n=1 Tax=Aureimonas mangrovi TaxID=2758041 RepID=UPI00163D54D6|nr:zinc ABC transporter substrate-binding protein [Aureimonas mangrovi]